MSMPAFVTPCSCDAWYDMNGMSPTTCERRAPRTTARQWYAISSSVTGSVVSWPWMTMPRESPTSRQSAPASSMSLAKVAS